MMTQIAVLHLMNDFGDCSITRVVQRLTVHLAEQGYTWHIGALRGSGGMQQEFRLRGAQVVDFSDPGDGSANLSSRIREYITAHQVKLVHSHTPRTILAATIALGRRRVVTHLATKHLLYFPGDRRWGLLYTLIDRVSLYLPDHLVAVSHKMYHQILAYPGLSARRVTAIQYAIDCDAYYVPEQRDGCRLELGLYPDVQVIGCIGRIEKMKRIDLLLEAFSVVLAEAPRARLVIVGDGKLRPRLEALAKRLGISHSVIWTGFRQDVPRLLAAMDVYVQPSTNEGLCISLLEALAAGKPVIATDVGGAREATREGRTAVLIPPGSVSAIAGSIVDLLGDRERRSALGGEARAAVLTDFGSEQMIDGYKRLYKALAPRT
jgi:glycosyltransferase involved in cell wall biosynthesis